MHLKYPFDDVFEIRFRVDGLTIDISLNSPDLWLHLPNIKHIIVTINKWTIFFLECEIFKRVKNHLTN